MSLFERIKALAFRTAEHSNVDVDEFSLDFDSSGINFRVDRDEIAALRHAQASGPAHNQMIVLQMLEEQGIAEALHNGFSIQKHAAARLDSEIAQMLALPPRFPGAFCTRVMANTTSPRFSITPTLRLKGVETAIDRTGPIVTVGGEDYMLSPSALAAIEAVEAHAERARSAWSEAANVELVALLQDAQRLAQSEEPEFNDPGFTPDLGHLDSFSTVRPERVGLIAEQQGDGSLLLAPDLGTDAAADDFLQRRHQLESGRVIRIDSQLTLLTESQQSAVTEIFSRAHIPATDVSDFLRAPGEYLDAENIDIDISFGVRVEGIGTVVPMTFSEASESGIDWLARVERLVTPAAMGEAINDADQLSDVREKISAARDNGATTITFEEKVVDVSDHEEVDRQIAKADKRISAKEPAGQPTPSAHVTIGMVIAETDGGADDLRRIASRSIQDCVPQFDGLRFIPFDHQREGIEWIAGLMDGSSRSEASGPRVQGGLLADDMGLGKTFMTLVALRHHIRNQKATGRAAKPVLAVLPLSLVENWEMEIDSAFDTSPFEDVVVLQTDRDLPRFRVRGRSRETSASEQDLDQSGMVKHDALRLSLRVGPQSGAARLDTPGRLVIATYQSLASYQLSLGQVDWGAVVFDEAQTIKNPETLASRAAKGLKADFKLLATGTPVENSLKDLWNLMDTVQPDLLGSWKEFRQRWVPGRDEPLEEVLALGRQLRDEVGPFMLRRTKESALAGLPKKTTHIGAGAAVAGTTIDPRLGVMMPGAQQEAYDFVLDSRSRSQGGALKTLQRLRSVSLHPGTTASAPDQSARMIAALDVLDAIRELGEKVIVFVIDKKVQLLLSQWLSRRYDLAVRIVNGDTSAVAGRSGRNGAGTRRSIIADFEAVDGFNVIIMSPLAVGTGLTIVGANHAIHLERHWNPAKEAQATDRIYRIGQKKPVHIYLPLALHPEQPSFDLNLDELLRSKTDLKDAIVVPGSIEDELVDRLRIVDS